MTASAARSTSVEVYHQIVENGLLTHQKALVYKHLYHHGPLTGRELTKALAEPGETATSYHKRLSELRDLGVVKECPVRECAVSGNAALTWDVTDALPTKVQRAKPPADLGHAAFRAAAITLAQDLMASMPPLFSAPYRRRLAELEEMP